MSAIVLTSCRPQLPTDGSALRTWQNIHALRLLGPVDVVSIGVDDARGVVDGVREWASFSLRQRSAIDRAGSLCWLLRPGVYPTVDRYHSRSVARWLRRRVIERGHDVAVVEGIAVASYVGDLKAAGCRVVFDAHNVESQLHRAALSLHAGRGTSIVRRAKDLVLQRRMELTERRAVRRSDFVWACSDRDARQLEAAYAPAAPVAVVANGVDVEAYRRPGTPGAGEDWSGVPITMVYPGLFGYLPNEDAAMRLVTEVLPAVRVRGQSARVVLVGRDPTRAMLRAAQRDPAVELTGAVETVLPHLEQPCVVTLPIALGSGTRLKIIEAFAVGRPVVSTAKGAEGIEAVDGEHLLIRDDPDAIARAVVELWASPPVRHRLCLNAFELARRKYSWSSAAQAIARSLGRARVPDGADAFHACLHRPERLPHADRKAGRPHPV